MAMSESAIERAADALATADRTAQPIDALPSGCAPANLEEAYAIQDRFVARLGRPVGYKIAYINRAVQERLGISAPLFGRLVEGRVFQSPAKLEAARFSNLIVETEFSFRMARALPASAAPFTLAEVESAIAAAIPSLELADSRFRSWRSLAAADAIADNALGSRWVGGAERADFRALDLAALEVTTEVNGRAVARGRGANVLGSPIRALHWLANALAQQGRALAAGDLVTTGCCTDILEVRPGDAATADFGPLGAVRVEFQA
jgi:2-keto-4-pentenoate hydratase